MLSRFHSQLFFFKFKAGIFSYSLFCFLLLHSSSTILVTQKNKVKQTWPLFQNLCYFNKLIWWNAHWIQCEETSPQPLWTVILYQPHSILWARFSHLKKTGKEGMLLHSLQDYRKAGPCSKICSLVQIRTYQQYWEYFYTFDFIRITERDKGSSDAKISSPNTQHTQQQWGFWVNTWVKLRMKESGGIKGFGQKELSQETFHPPTRVETHSLTHGMALYKCYYVLFLILKLK